MSIVIWTPGGM